MPSGAGGRGARVVSFVLSLGLGACGDPPPPEAPVAPPPPPLPIAAPRAVSTSAAFDLVATADGAVLVWGVPPRVGGGVRALALSATGAAQGHEVDVARRGMAAGGAIEEAPAQVTEISAIASGRRVGVVWMVERGDERRVQATFSSAGAESFAPVRDLEQAPPATEGRSRGRVTVAVQDDGAIVASYRIPDAACRASEGHCARFGRSRVDGDEDAARGDEPLEVRSPCDPLLVGALSQGGTHHFGVCHDDGGPRTTVYAINPAISYAGATDLLASCTPFAMSPVPGGVAVSARCADGIGVARVDGHGRSGPVVRPATLTPRCEGEQPVLEATGDGVTLSVPLRERATHIEGLLPERIAPASSRAVWTGESVLVAVPLGNEVGLRRYDCELGELVRSDVP